MSGRLLMALFASLAVVLAAPFVGQARGALQEALPDQYRNIVLGMVAIGVVGIVAIALTMIRERRLLRYSLLAGAVGGGVVYAYLTRTDNPEVNAVEWFHFVEYGLLTLLFHRVWRDAGDLSSLALPAVAVFVVGTLDEGFQWFVPARVGELRDVFLNLAAIACGLVCGGGIEPPRRLAHVTGRTRRNLFYGLAVAVLALSVFVYTVHMGYDVRDGSGDGLLSRFSEEDLRFAAIDRSERWKTAPPVELRRLSREDQYLAEGLWHIQARSVAFRDGDLPTAFKENQILETWFAPVLDFPTYLTPETERWPPERKAAVAEEVVPGAEPFISDASPIPIYTWSRAAFTIAASALVMLFAISGFVAQPGPDRP
jgi:VanZ family protein